MTEPEPIPAAVRERVQSLVLAGLRNQEIHRRSARPLLEAVGVPGQEASDLVWAVEEEV